jgi:hypothetical protein
MDWLLEVNGEQLARKPIPSDTPSHFILLKIANCLSRIYSHAISACMAEQKWLRHCSAVWEPPLYYVNEYKMFPSLLTDETGCNVILHVQLIHQQTIF